MSRSSRAEYDRIWEEIQEDFGPAYVRELHWLARTVVGRLDHLFQEAPDENVMSPRRELLEDIADAVNAGARIRALLVPRPRRGAQSQVEHEILVRRANWLRSLVSSVPLDELLDARSRHSLEHFDEALDRTAISWQKGLLGPDVMIPMDTLFGSRAVANALRQGELAGTSIHFLRAYFADDRTFLNANQEAGIGRLRDEAAALVECLQPHLGGEGVPGALPGDYAGQPLGVIGRFRKGRRPASDASKNSLVD